MGIGLPYFLEHNVMIVIYTYQVSRIMRESHAFASILSHESNQSHAWKYRKQSVSQHLEFKGEAADTAVVGAMVRSWRECVIGSLSVIDRALDSPAPRALNFRLGLCKPCGRGLCRNNVYIYHS